MKSISEETPTTYFPSYTAEVPSELLKFGSLTTLGWLMKLARLVERR